MPMDETQTLIEIPQAAYDAGNAAIVHYYDDDERAANAVQKVLQDAVPLVLAAELLRLADQLTELADAMVQKFDPQSGGVFDAITVIRERATQLSKRDS